MEDSLADDSCHVWSVLDLLHFSYSNISFKIILLILMVVDYIAMV